MSWYRIAIFLCLSTMIVEAKTLMPTSQSEEIMRALVYDEYHAYENARQTYANLFDDTKVEQFLFKEARASLYGKTHISQSITRLKTWEMTHPDRLESKRLLIPLYMTNNKLDFAKNEAEFLAERSTIPTDLELASNPFLYSGEFKRALVLLDKVYSAHPTERILLRMTDIMVEYTHEDKRAIQMLETYRRMNTYSNDVLAKLLVLYSKAEDVDGLLDTYKVLYENTKDIKVLNKIIDIYGYKKDIDGAIAFLQTQEAGDNILYELYKTNHDYTKALTLVEKRYQKESNPRWLAEKGILLFEAAKDKRDKKMLDTVVSTFDKAIALGVDDSVYLNYYGYVLIDQEIDIDKGMKIIQNALNQQPNNTYYLDSLAWGYYKKHQCSLAYKTMKKVVDEEGLSIDEIIGHWRAIKQCK